MKTPLALLNLWHQPTKTLVNVGGVSFALLLVFMQLGFMGAVSYTATNVLESMRFDILLRARDYLHLYEPSQFESKWLRVAESTQGVIAAKPIWITLHNWRKLPTHLQIETADFETQYLPLAVMAFDTRQDAFKLDSVMQQCSLLNSGNEVLLDRSTQREYGPLDGNHFREIDIGRETEIGGQKFSIAGLFNLGTGLAANGAAIASQQGFARIVPWDVNRHVSIGLIDIDSAADIDAVVSDLKFRFQVGNAQSKLTAVEILTREQVMLQETSRWLWQTPIGLIFQLGVVLSLLVGAAIVYMVLSTDVTNRLPEYATLLAIGYSRKYLASIVMTQAVSLCMCGFLVAWGAAILLYWLTTNASGIPVAMNNQRAVLVLVMGLVMCCCSGLLALRKLWKAEPASLF